VRPAAVVTGLVLVVAVAACSGDVTDSIEYQQLEERLVSAEADLADTATRLAEVTAERDALAAAPTEEEPDPDDPSDVCAEAAAARHAKTQATIDRVIEITADPAAYGTEAEVLDLLDTLAAPGTLYRDEAFGGAIGWRPGWRNTLYGDLDATVTTWQRWISDDGSSAGALWTWSGTAENGEPFDLIGINLNTYDEEGLVTSATVYYPYESSYVQEVFANGG